jgi:hypothetical protein
LPYRKRGEGERQDADAFSRQLVEPGDAGYQKDGNDAYLEATKKDPEAFHKNELGQMAEFMVNYSKMSEIEREDLLSKAMNSDST